MKIEIRAETSGRKQQLDVLENVLLQIGQMFRLVVALVALQVGAQQLLRGRRPGLERNTTVVAKMLSHLGGIDEVPGTTNRAFTLAHLS